MTMATHTSPLDRITIASPCHVSWNEMSGDERVRFCSQCSLHVYNLSEMTRSEAEALIAEKEGKLCVRYYRRKDGTMLTQDCPVGVQATRMQRVRSIRRAMTAGAAILISVVGLEASQMSPRADTGGDDSEEYSINMGEPLMSPEHSDDSDSRERVETPSDTTTVISEDVLTSQDKTKGHNTSEKKGNPDID